MMSSSKVSRMAGVGIAVLALCLAGSAQAATRMYSGSLIIHAFANDVTTGTGQYGEARTVGIPLTGNCNEKPFHAEETFHFTLSPTMPYKTPYTVQFTIPSYGGAVKDLDTNGDTVPDVVAGCQTQTISEGDPLVGTGVVNTTGDPGTSRAATAPRGFTLPEWALRRHKTGASFEQYGVYLWEVHFADLHNAAGTTTHASIPDNGIFKKDGGVGAFNIEHVAAPTKRSVNQKAGTNQFGGVMRLLGIYGDFEGYLYANTITSVFTFDWLFDYMGMGGFATDGGGVVTAGYNTTSIQQGHTKTSGYPTTSTVAHSVFPWTTGTVTVTAKGGTFKSILHRNGYDNRTPMGAGVVQMVSPMITAWTGAGTSSTSGIGVLKVEFAPEPSEWMLLASGISLLGLLAWRRSGRR